MPSANDIAARRASAWYRQPVAWLGVLIFAGSLAGCVWMIMLGASHADTPLEASHTVFGVPVSAHSAGGQPVHPTADPPQ